MWDFLNTPLVATIVGTVLAAPVIAFVAYWWRRRRPAPATPTAPTSRRRVPRHLPTPEEQARHKRALANAVEQIERQFGKGSVKRMTPKPKEPPKGS